MDSFPKFKVASVQSSPVFLDTLATTKKACGLITEASSQGAKIVAFPEVFISAYPYWNWIMNPIEGSSWYEKLYKASVDVPSVYVDMLCKSAKENNTYVVIGINERAEHTAGGIYNTLLFISNGGEIIEKHRKMVPTWAEKLTWTGGDGSTLNVHKTKDIGNVGMLACGENTNTLARFALLAQGENLHIASYISLPVAPADYDMAEAIKLRAMAHSFEGKLFTIVSCSIISQDVIDAMSADVPNIREKFKRKNSAFSGVIGPDGRVIGKPLIDDEGIVYADIDLSACIQPKQMHDIVGHYNRFDIFNFSVNKTKQSPMSIIKKNKDNKEKE